MRIAFCTTCKGRLSHLKETLPRNIADNAGYRDAVFVILNYNSPDGLEEFIRERYRPELDSGRIALYRFTEPCQFRMAHAKNLAHRLGIAEGADILVNLDADNFTGPGFAEYIARQLEPRGNRFLWARLIRGKRGIAGRIVVSKNTFLLAGGYDEDFHHWGSDDKDFNARISRLGAQPVEIPQEYLDVINHNDKIRFREYPHIANRPDMEDAEVNPVDPIANAGRFGCGVVYRNFDPRPIEFGPVPTRIFGIGWHKTATTSLYHAFEILGFRSAHWTSAHWAKAIWEEMRHYDRSPTLERHYAFTDFPFPLLYRQLDTGYPGSKFILTVRPDGEWLESARKHWSDSNPWRKQWNRDAFSHRIHQLAYGRRDFDPQTFLARYQRHNAEVREYFKGRSDLLVMDFAKPTGWYELCGFLKQPIPAQPFPRANVAS